LLASFKNVQVTYAALESTTLKEFTISKTQSHSTTVQDSSLLQHENLLPITTHLTNIIRRNDILYFLIIISLTAGNSHSININNTTWQRINKRRTQLNRSIQ